MTKLLIVNTQRRAPWLSNKLNMTINSPPVVLGVFPQAVHSTPVCPLPSQGVLQSCTESLRVSEPPTLSLVLSCLVLHELLYLPVHGRILELHFTELRDANCLLPLTFWGL